MRNYKCKDTIKHIILLCIFVVGIQSVAAQTTLARAMQQSENSKPTEEEKIAEYKEKIGLDYFMPDISLNNIKKIDEGIVGTRLANYLVYIDENYNQPIYNRWIASIIAEQNATVQNTYFEVVKLKLVGISKKGNDIVLKYIASLKDSENEKSTADLLFHFTDGVSNSNRVNNMFSYIARFIRMKD